MFDFCKTSGLTVCGACRTNLSCGYVAGSAQQVAVAIALAAHLPMASVLTSASPWTAKGRTQGEPPLQPLWHECPRYISSNKMPKQSFTKSQANELTATMGELLFDRCYKGVFWNKDCANLLFNFLECPTSSYQHKFSLKILAVISNNLS